MLYINTRPKTNNNNIIIFISINSCIISVTDVHINFLIHNNITNRFVWLMIDSKLHEKQYYLNVNGTRLL